MERRLSASDTKGPWVVRAIWPLNHAWVSMERLGSTLVTQVHENHRYVYSIYADSFTIKSCKGWRTQTARVHFEMNWLQYIELPESCHSKRSSRSIVILPSYQDSRIWSGVAWSARVKLLSLSLLCMIMRKFSIFAFCVCVRFICVAQNLVTSFGFFLWWNCFLFRKFEGSGFA